MKKIIFLLILLLYLVAPTTFANVNFEPLFLWDGLFELPEKKQNFDVIQRIKEAIKKDPENYTNYSALAIVYDYNNLYEEAVEALKSAIKYYPDDEGQKDFVYGNLARMYLILKQLDKAKDALDKAMEYNPTNAVNNVHLTQYYLMKNKYEKAALTMKKDSDYNGKEDTYFDWYQYALNKLEIGALGLTEVFKHVVQLDPENYSAHRTLATAIRGDLTNLEKNFPEVMKEYNKSLDLKPQYIPTYICIADTYMFMAMRTKDESYNKQALEWFAKAYELDPKNEKLFYAMASFYNYNKRYDEAILKIKKAISLGFNDKHMMIELAKIYNNKAYSLYQKGKDLEKGLEIIEKAIALAPDDGIILSTKAELLYKMNKFEEAYIYIKKAIVLEPDHLEIKQDLENIENALKRVRIESNNIGNKQEGKN